MIQVSTDVANALSQLSREFDAKIYVNGSAVDCEIMSLKLHKGACGKFTVGSIFIPYVELTVNGTTTLTTNTEFELKIAVKVNGSFGTYYRVGYFTPTSIEDGRTQTEIYAQGRIANTNEVLFSTEPTSRSLSNIFSALQSWCTSKGFSAQLKGLTLPSASIDQLLPLKDFTVRDTISLLVSCAGGYATEDYNGNIQLCKFQSTTPQNIKADQLAEYPVIKGTYTLTGITVVVNESLKYDIGSSPQFEIQNPYFNSNMVSQFTSNTIGYSFPVTEMPIALGDFRYEAWDYVAIESGLTPSNSLVPSDNLVPQDGLYSEAFPCLTLDFDFDGGLKTSIKAEGELPDEQSTKTAGPFSAQLKEAYDKAIGANNLAQQASQDASAAYDMAESAYDGEGTTVSLTYKTQFAYGTTTAPVGAWQDTVPTLTTTNPYLWTKLVTIETTTTYNEETGQHTTTTRTIDQGSPSKSTLLDGVYTFINAAENGTSTVINGGSIMANTIYGNTINLSRAIYTGSHTSLFSGNAGAYLGSDGIEYTSPAGGSSNYQARVTMFMKDSIYSKTSDPVFQVENKYSGSSWGITASISSDGYIKCSRINASGTVTGSNIPSGTIVVENSSPTFSTAHATTFQTVNGGTVQIRNSNGSYVNNLSCDSSGHLTCPSIYNRSASSGGTAVRVDSGGELFRYTSSRRVKKDIKDVEDFDLTTLYDIPVRQYKYKEGAIPKSDPYYNKDIVGLIAEEVGEALPVACVKNSDGDAVDWDERYIIVGLLKLVQEQNERIKDLERRL